MLEPWKQTKTCLNCGVLFERGVRTDRKSVQATPITIWKLRKYCSRKCSATHEGKIEHHRAMAKERGFGKWMAGKKLSIETRKKIGAAGIGHKRNLGKKRTEAEKEHLSRVLRGENGPMWRGGKMSEKATIRGGLEYRRWRAAVFSRDNYTCQLCGIRGVKLHADHILPFSLFPSKRTDINNGRTLCVPCHKKTDTYLVGYKKLRQMYDGHPLAVFD